MKRIISIFIVSLMLLSTAVFVAEGAPEYYFVSPTGKDGASGSQSDPFPSLKAAKDKIKGQDGATIFFLEGKYPITEKVTFETRDAGTARSPVTYKAFAGHEVIFTGAVPLNKELFTKVEDMETLMKLPEISRSKVLMLDLTKQGLTTVSNQYPVLYANDIQATVARYPNSGYAVSTNTSKSNTFDTGYANVAKWSEDSIKNAVVTGNIEYSFDWKKTSITSVSGTKITLSDTVRRGSYYYVRNLIEELDAPGEYIVKDNILYYYPISPIENLDMEIITFNDETMIELTTNSTSYINFEGITFEKAISSAITTAGKSPTGITIKNCEFKYLMREALNISGSDHIISDNYAYGCGSRFINFVGGSRANITPGNILIEKNRIVGCGYWSPGNNTGVIMGGINTHEDLPCMGNKVINNIIQDCYSFAAIHVTGNDNEIKYNEVINMGLVIEDGGAIYSGKSATKYGTKIMNNYIHDFRRDAAYDYSAIYPDDGISGLTVEHNVVARVSKAFTSGLGANNKIENNLFIDTRRGMSLGERMNWTDGNYYMGEGKLYWEACRLFYETTGANSEEYQLVRDDEGNPVFKTGSAIAEPYKEKYPEILQAVNDHIYKGYPFFAPWNTKVTGNVLISNEDLTTISTRPTHPLQTEKGSGIYVVPGEEVLDSKVPSMIQLKEGTVNTVDELATYGDSVANAAGINATSKGNPKLKHSEVSFEDAANQNYNLTSGPITNSTVHEIDMTPIGIFDTTNPKIFKDRDDRVKFLDVAYDSNRAIVAWEPVENASTYEITVTKEGSSKPVASEKDFRNIFHTNKYEFKLDGEGTYSITIKAKGLSRQDSFVEEGTKVFNFGGVYTANLENALEILRSRIDALKGKVEVSNMAELEAGYAENLLVLENGTQSEVDDAVIAVYELLDLLDATVEPKVTRFAADQNTNMVYVEAIGFPANSLATVMVTNPYVTFKDATDNASTETIRFLTTVQTDNLGMISVSFDTSENEIDYTGVYKVYVKSANKSEIVEKEYTYGTVELSDVVFKSGDSVISKAELAPGQKVTLSMSVKNRLPRELKPEAYLGIYEKGVLKCAFVQNQTAISKNSNGTIEISVEIPQTYTSESELKLFMWDDASGKLLRPLTKTIVIVE